MKRGAFIVLGVLLILFFAGCNFGSDDVESTIPITTTLMTGPADQSSVDSQTGPVQFAAYNLTISSPKLAVHSGPGYSYATVSYITDQGSYLIVAEEMEKLDGGDATVWGKISGRGWINLEDSQAAAIQSSVPTEPAEEEFVPYLLHVMNPWLEIYSGPGYDYMGNDSIRGGGVFTIVEETIQYFGSSRFVTWGKLKSGAGWICLDDAKLVTESGPPYRCTECGRADVPISRHSLCDG